MTYIVLFLQHHTSPLCGVYRLIKLEVALYLVVMTKTVKIWQEYPPGNVQGEKCLNVVKGWSRVYICIYSLLNMLRQNTWLWCVHYKIKIREWGWLYIQMRHNVTLVTIHNGWSSWPATSIVHCLWWYLRLPLSDVRWQSVWSVNYRICQLAHCVFSTLIVMSVDTVNVC